MFPKPRFWLKSTSYNLALFQGIFVVGFTGLDPAARPFLVNRGTTRTLTTSSPEFHGSYLLACEIWGETEQTDVMPTCTDLVDITQILRLTPQVWVTFSTDCPARETSEIVESRAAVFGGFFLSPGVWWNLKAIFKVIRVQTSPSPSKSSFCRVDNSAALKDPEVFRTRFCWVQYWTDRMEGLHLASRSIVDNSPWRWRFFCLSASPGGDGRCSG